MGLERSVDLLYVESVSSVWTSASPSLFLSLSPQTDVDGHAWRAIHSRRQFHVEAVRVRGLGVTAVGLGRSHIQ